MFVVGVAHALSFWPYVNDDAFIAFRYSLRLAQGHGPYFNAGEHVEGYSSLLWVLGMVPVAWSLGAAAVPIAAKVLGVASQLGALGLTFLLARRLAANGGREGDAAGAGVLATALLAVSPSYAVNSVSGLETAFYGFALALGVYLGVRRPDVRGHASGIAFAVAAVTRPEAIAVLAMWALVRVLAPILDGERSWRQPMPSRSVWIEGAWPVAALVTQVAFRFVAYDGELLPNTYYAKLGGFWRNAWTYLSDGLLVPYGGWLAVCAGLAACPGATSRRSSLPVAALGIAGVLLPFVTGTDWMLGERLIVPYLPIMACLIGVGWWRLLHFLVGGRVGWQAVAAALVVGALWVQTTAKRMELRQHVLVHAEGYRAGHRALADWICGERSRPGDTIALMDIGIVGYRCVDRRVLDISGLTDRLIAKSPGPFLRKQYDVAYVLDQKPRFVVLTVTKEGDPTRPPPGFRFQPWTPVEGAIYRHPEFRRSYVRTPSSIGDTGNWLARAADAAGAVRAFQHLHPGRYYVLMVFERREVPAG